MNKKHLALVLILLVLGSLTAWESYRTKIENEQGTPARPALKTNGNSILTLATDTDEGEFYRTKVTYPTFPPVAEHVKTIVAEFKKQVTDSEKIDLATITRNGEHKYELMVNTATYHSGDTTSYVFQIYEDTLGAHGNTRYETHTYRTDGTEVHFTELFDANSPYLGKLSEVAREKVAEEYKKRGIDPDNRWINEGTAGKLESFSAWYLDQENLVIIFPPYSVAAYAFGTFEARIPFTEIQDILSKN